MRNPWPRRFGSIELRDIKATDIETLLVFRNEKQVIDFMINTYVEPETFRAKCLQIETSDVDFSCVATLEGEIVGLGFLELEDGSGQPGVAPQTEALIGYIIDPKHWGKKIGSELANGLLNAAFDSLDVRRVIAGCFSDNIASVKILEGIGMRRERHGVADSWHSELGWVDSYEYAILKEEWNQHNLDSGL